MTPCGAVVCTGCAKCIKAWATTTGIRLQPWQRALVGRMFPPDPILDRLLVARPELAQTNHLGVALRATYLESA